MRHRGGAGDVDDLSEQVGDMRERHDPRSLGKYRFQIIEGQRAGFGIDLPPSNHRAESLEFHPASDVGFVPLLTDHDLVARFDGAADRMGENMHETRATRTEYDASEAFAIDESVHETVGPLDRRGRPVTGRVSRAELAVVVQQVIANRIGHRSRDLGSSRVLEENGSLGEGGIVTSDVFDVHRD